MRLVSVVLDQHKQRYTEHKQYWQDILDSSIAQLTSLATQELSYTAISRLVAEITAQLESAKDSTIEWSEATSGVTSETIKAGEKLEQTANTIKSEGQRLFRDVFDDAGDAFDRFVDRMKDRFLDFLFDVAWKAAGLQKTVSGLFGTGAAGAAGGATAGAGAAAGATLGGTLAVAAPLAVFGFWANALLNRRDKMAERLAPIR